MKFVQKICALYAENERSLPAFSRSFLSANSFDVKTKHGRGRGLGLRSIFFLPWVVWSILQPFVFRFPTGRPYYVFVVNNY